MYFELRSASSGHAYLQVTHFNVMRQSREVVRFGSGHTAYRRASLIDLHLHTKLHWNRRNFFSGRTYGRTCGRTDV